ncbi:MAG TPA: DUF6600 domain-containing protein [Rhizomicrobium sp.]|nr:DUF6600 domain-containing protein [Rhizomicrobium sp.]
MNRTLRARLLASALIASAASLICIPEIASAQEVSADVSFTSFHDRLSTYGNWSHNPRYGDVWRPRDVDADFHPYSRGHWVDTEYGFTWVSDYQWGDVPFHYGRWVNDADDGWVWVPGYVWAPAWVVWRSDSDYMGWAPMPPDERFLAGDETRFDVDPVAFYGARVDVGNLFIFVGTRHIADPDFRTYIVRRPEVVNIFHRTRNITRISIVNDHVVNRSVDVRVVERFTHRPIRAVSIRTVLKPGAIVTNVHIGRNIDIRERVSHPRGNTAPGNNGNNGNDNGHGPNGNNGNGNDHGGNNNDHGGNNNDHGGSNNDHGGATGGPSGTQGGHDNNDMNTKTNTNTNTNANTPSSDQTPAKPKNKKPGDNSMQGSQPDNGGGMSDQGAPGASGSGGGMSGGGTSGGGTSGQGSSGSTTHHHDSSSQNNGAMQGGGTTPTPPQTPQTNSAPPKHNGGASGSSSQPSGSQSDSQDTTPPKHKKKEDDNGSGNPPSGSSQ